MPYSPGECGNLNGRPKGKSNKNKIEELLGADKINAAFLADFEKGVLYVRQLAFEHYYGKPVQKNENEHTFPDAININLIKGNGQTTT